MADRKLLGVFGRLERYSLWIETNIRFQWFPSLYRFQGNGWHLYFWKFRFTRASRRVS